MITSTELSGISAGSKPTGTVHPEALGQLKSAGLSTDNLRCKSWEEFANSGAPKMDFVFTDCDNAANETCPLWPAQPRTAHGSVPDPAAAQETPSTLPAPSAKPSWFSIAGSICCCVSRLQALIRWPSSRTSVASEAIITVLLAMKLGYNLAVFQPTRVA